MSSPDSAIRFPNRWAILHNGRFIRDDDARVLQFYSRFAACYTIDVMYLRSNHTAANMRAVPLPYSAHNSEPSFWMEVLVREALTGDTKPEEYGPAVRWASSIVGSVRDMCDRLKVDVTDTKAVAALALSTLADAGVTHWGR